MSMFDQATDNDFKVPFSQKIKSFISGIFDKLQGLVLLAAFLVILYLVLITPHQVDGVSMFPTYKNDELMIANKLVYRFKAPERGDVIIFELDENRDYVKRVIGIPGDSIKIANGAVYLNDKKLDESEYLASDVKTYGANFMSEGQTRIVPEGHVFVLGDNRPKSIDSRSIGVGFKPYSAIKGEIFVVIYPFTDFRFISAPDYNL